MINPIKISTPHAQMCFLNYYVPVKGARTFWEKIVHLKERKI
jgi:hypothetical protein